MKAVLIATVGHIRTEVLQSFRRNVVVLAPKEVLCGQPMLAETFREIGVDPAFCSLHRISELIGSLRKESAALSLTRFTIPGGITKTRERRSTQISLDKAQAFNTVATILYRGTCSALTCA